MHNIESYNLNNPETDTKVLDLQNALVQAREQIEDLKESDELKDEFISLATHQLRGPLGAIKGYISLIQEGDYGEVPKGMHEPINIITKSLDSMGKTINDFLDVSRIDQGEMRYYKKDFDLAHLAQDVVNEMKNIIEDSGLELRLNISPEILMIHGDKTKLKHVLLNLVDNASKYTKNGFIEISVAKRPYFTENFDGTSSKVLFTVKDSGVGIKPETMPLLFRKFSRCKDASKANILGTGLGLYIAKKMIEAQKGHIWAESEGEGKGSQFYVELDLVPARNI